MPEEEKQITQCNSVLRPSQTNSYLHFICLHIYFLTIDWLPGDIQLVFLEIQGCTDTVPTSILTSPAAEPDVSRTSRLATIHYDLLL